MRIKETLKTSTSNSTSSRWSEFECRINLQSMKSFLYKFLILSTFLLSFSISYTQAESIQGPFSKKYVQCFASENTAFFGEKYKDTCGPIGWASYHFVNESEVYINWWEFDTSYEDGSKARTKYFENISFDDVSRTFRGMLIFDKTIPDFGSPKKFDYEMIFNEDYSMIHNGKIKVTEQDGNIAERNYNYRNLTRGNRGSDWWYESR